MKSLPLLYNRIYEMITNNTFNQRWIFATFLFMVFVFSFTCKIAYVVYTDNLDFGGGAPDTITYMRASTEILEGKLFSSTDVPTLGEYPGFPIYLTMLRLIIGDEMFGLRMASIVMYSLICVLACYFAYISFGKISALLTAPFVVLSPVMTFWSHFVLSESLFTFLLLISMIGCAYLIRFERHQITVGAVSGLAFGFASWTRPILFPLIAFFCLGLLVRWLLLRKGLSKGFLVLILCAFLLFGSWAIRNTLVLGKSHIPFLRGLEIQKKVLIHYFTDDSEEKLQHIVRGPFLDKASFFATSGGKAFYRYWYFSLLGTHQTFWNSNVVRLYVFYYVPTFIMMLLSLKYFRREAEILSLLWLLIIYFTLVYTLTFYGGAISGRFRIPIEPYISILAGYSLFRVIRGCLGYKKL